MNIAETRPISATPGGSKTTKVILLHPSLNQRGGAEKVCVRMIETLLGSGHDVTLYSIEKTQWKQIESSWGTTRRPREIWCLKDQRYTRLPLIRWPLLLSLYLCLLIKAAKKRDHVSLNNYGEVLPLFADASYVHSLPLRASAGNPFSIPIWGIAKPLYHALLCILSRRTSPLILTNSNYNAAKNRTLFKAQIIVLYPPVDRLIIRRSPKSPSTLTMSRLSKPKNLEIIPKIARLVSTRCEFNICLSSTEGSSIDPLRGPTIKITANPPAELINRLRETSAIYLSTQPTEAFGLSILEAMSAGCIPVVPRDGGPWWDILEEKQGEVGFAYNTPAEAAEHIDKILGDAPLAKTLAEASRKRAEKFQGTSFGIRLLKVLAALHAEKTRNV